MRILLALTLALPLYIALGNQGLYWTFLPLMILQIFGGLDYKLFDKF